MALLAKITRSFITALVIGAGVGTAFAADLDSPLRLNTSISVKDDSIRLGDIFSGYLTRPEKVVAKAPHPGQRLTLTADWLRDLAHKQGLDWEPANMYDRAVVYQPGQIISVAEITAAVKADLIAKGMPSNFSVAMATPINQVMLPMNAAADVGIREAFYDPASRAYSAVVEIPPGDPKAQFIPLRGIAFPTVAVPVAKENVAKNTVITSAMLTTLDLPEDQVKPTTITDTSALLGKAPKVFLRSGQPIYENDVAQMSLVEVPVLTVDMERDGVITKKHVRTITLNAADLPRDIVTDTAELLGRSPRRMVVAGAPIRRGDVQLVQEVRIPVLTRDLPRGAKITEETLSWINMSEGDLGGQILTDARDIIGRETKHPMRAGQGLHTFDITRPIVVMRGKLVTILFSVPMIKLTAQGQALEPGGIGDVIKILNTKSNVTVTAEIIDAQTVRISNQQTAMR